MFTRRAQEIVGAAIESAVEDAEDEEPTTSASSWEELQPYLARTTNRHGHKKAA